MRALNTELWRILERGGCDAEGGTALFLCEKLCCYIRTREGGGEERGTSIGGVAHLRPRGELEHLLDDGPARGELPREQPQVYRVEGDVRIARVVVALLHDDALLSLNVLKMENT